MNHLDREISFWNGVAEKYGRSPIKDMPGYERTVIETRALLRPADHVVEIGCGTGMTALRLARSVASYVGTDLSSQMIAIARRRAQEADFPSASDSVRFAVAAADRLPMGTASCDVVMGFNLLHLVPDRAAVLSEVRRVLKPGGLFIAKTPCLSEMNALIRLAVPLMQWVGKAPHVAFFTAEQLQQEITLNGFAMVTQGRHGSGRRDPRIFTVARTAPVAEHGGETSWGRDQERPGRP